MGVPFTAAHGSIRFSLSIYNTEEEIDYVLKHLPPIIHRLREISALEGRAERLRRKNKDKGSKFKV
jgi:cysteine desulfurase